MGWWRITDVETGGCRTDEVGPQHPECYYNGDDPVDLAGGWLYDAVATLSRVGLPPTRAAATALWCGGPLAGLSAYSRNAMDEAVKECKEALIRVYYLTWERPPYQEEIEAVFNFVCNSQFDQEPPQA